MQMCRPSNELYEQLYNYQSSVQPYSKPAGYGASNFTQCQTQTQCFDANPPGYAAPHHAAGGYGNHHGGLQSFGNFAQKPYGQGSDGSIQSGKYGSSQHGSQAMGHHGSYDNGHQGTYASRHQGAYASGHHGSFGSGCEGQSGSFKYSMKKKESRSWRKRSGNDRDCSGSDESDNEC